jgi:hypothetical protein
MAERHAFESGERGGADASRLDQHAGRWRVVRSRRLDRDPAQSAATPP